MADVGRCRCVVATNNKVQNRLLGALSPVELAGLSDDLERVDLSFKEPLQEIGKPIRYMHFPNSGVISKVSELHQGMTVETGTIGREGVSGLDAFLGVTNSTDRVFCQIPGKGFRIRPAAVRAAVDDGSSLGPLLLRYTHAVMAMLAQGVACNAQHTLEQRMCRWLLMTRDRVDSDTFPLTQEFLAMMLGVRRPSVSVIGAMLQQAGFIQYRRGRMTILNRSGLKEASCECYAFVQAEFERALDGGGRQSRISRR